MAEYWNVYDYNRRDTGKLIQRGTPMKQDEYHIVVNVWLKNNNGEYLISQRSPNKTNPLCWEATGGSILAGETSLQGAVREVKEELGIELDPTDGHFLCSGHRQYDDCPDILDVWLFDCNVPIESIVLQEGETADAKYATKDEIRQMICTGDFIKMKKYDYLSVLGI